jgi:hypothetical protein
VIADNQIGGAARLLLNLFGVEQSFVSARSEIGQQAGGFQDLCHIYKDTRQAEITEQVKRVQSRKIAT